MGRCEVASAGSRRLCAASSGLHFPQHRTWSGHQSLKGSMIHGPIQTIQKEICIWGATSPCHIRYSSDSVASLEATKSRGMGGFFKHGVIARAADGNIASRKTSHFTDLSPHKSSPLVPGKTQVERSSPEHGSWSVCSPSSPAAHRPGYSQKGICHNGVVLVLVGSEYPYPSYIGSPYLLFSRK